jgi:predicted nuclease with RNAse H fold
VVVVCGVDLRGVARKPSGVALLGEGLLYVGVFHWDEELLELVRAYRPSVVAVDAPLSPAEGFREVDREMLRRGFRVLPPGWRGMRALVERAVRLSRELASLGVTVIETHPRSALAASGCTAETLLRMHGVEPCRELTRDELDAIISAIVARYYAEGVRAGVSGADGCIYLLPRLC